MKTLKTLLIGCALILFSGMLYAQPANAGLSKSGKIVLNDDAPLSSVYAIDASSFNFDSEQEAISYFRNLNTDDVVFRPVLQNNVVMMYLQINKHPEWTKSQWMERLEDIDLLKKQQTPNQSLTK